MRTTPHTAEPLKDSQSCSEGGSMRLVSKKALCATAFRDGQSLVPGRPRKVILSCGEEGVPESRGGVWEW